jgi:hypothetical protein
MSHKLNKREFDARKADQIEARDTLELPHKPPKNVPEMRDRLYLVEQYLGLAVDEE